MIDKTGIVYCLIIINNKLFFLIYLVNLLYIAIAKQVILSWIN